MPGLEHIGHAPLDEARPAVALTLPPPEPPAKDKPASLKKIPVSAPEASEDVAYRWPLKRMTREQFQKGAYLFRAGDPAEKLFYITRGTLRLPEIKKIVSAGQVIGEMGIFSPGKTRTASAVCEEDLEAYTLTRNQVLDFFSRDPALALNLLQLSNKRFIENLKAETEASARIKSELSVAREIQASMLPRTFPPFPERREFEIYATMDAAEEVGGDFYDFFFADKNKLCVVVGDVSGKGVPAALFMAISKALIKSEALRGYPADQILSRANKLLCPENQRCMFVTVLCVLLNTATGEIEYCSGGHNPPVLCTDEGSVDYLQVPQGKVVGVMEDAQFESRKLQLKAGDLLLLYTDGVTEAMNTDYQLFSEDRLKACLPRLRTKGVAELVAGLRSEIASHVQGHPQSDDITLLALRYRG